LVRYRTGNDAAETVSDKVNLATGFRARLGDRLIQVSLDQKIRTVCIDADT
jgi:hypothetical protein